MKFPKLKLIKIKTPPFFFKIEKRVRFVISSLILSVLLLISTFFYFDSSWIFIPIFIIASYALTYFSILEGIEKIEWVTLFLMPVFFTVAFYVFYFLFPVRWLTRVPFVLLYLISMYALFLTSNIFNVGVEKNLRLYKAAFSVNYFYQTFLIFLVSNALFSFRSYFFVNAIICGVVVFLLSLQLLWSIKLDLNLEKDVVKYSAFLSIVLAQLALIIAFMPFRPSIMSLIIAASYYSFSGLITAYLDNRLFRKTVREFIFVFSFVFIIAVLTLGSMKKNRPVPDGEEGRG